VSTPKRFGLPDNVRRMRHDTHYVDQLAHPSGEPIGRMIPIEDIRPNPNQPRQEIGDLSELTSSVREKGILEPLLVRARDGHFEIIAGERRYRAAMEAGLAELPCIVRETSDAEMMEVALIENLQRKDLHPLEEADGFRMLRDSFNYTHEEMAARLGKSRTAITEALSLATLPDEVRDRCRLADIRSKSLLLEIVRKSELPKMLAFLDQMRQEGASTREEVRKLAKPSAGRGRPKNYVFNYQPTDKSYKLSVQFKKSNVGQDEVVSALKSLIKELQKQLAVAEQDAQPDAE
jgi:ParB family chromosome partitioning protein